MEREVAAGRRSGRACLANYHSTEMMSESTRKEDDKSMTEVQGSGEDGIVERKVVAGPPVLEIIMHSASYIKTPYQGFPVPSEIPLCKG